MQIFSAKNIIIALITLTLAACASGSAIVTGTKRTPLDPNQVTLYIEPPANYEVVALVSASSDAVGLNRVQLIML